MIKTSRTRTEILKKIRTVSVQTGYRRLPMTSFIQRRPVLISADTTLGWLFFQYSLLIDQVLNLLVYR